MISDDVPKTEWARLAFYASHVATVGVRGLFRNNKKRRISSAVWSHIGRLASGEPLLPNLREISWSWTSIQCFALPHIIPPFSSPSHRLCFDYPLLRLNGERNTGIGGGVPNDVTCSILHRTGTGQPGHHKREECLGTYRKAPPPPEVNL